MTFILRRRWPNLKQIPAGTPIDDYWIQRGLKSFYILDAQRWKINQVTGLIGGNSVGTGVTFPNGWLRTPGSASNGATLEHRLSVDITYPITIVYGFDRVISAGMFWTLTDDGASTWYGFYAGAFQAGGAWAGGANFNVALNNNFTGAVDPGGRNGAYCVRGTNDLRGAGANSGALTGFQTDTSFNAPTTVSPTTVALGWARRSSGSNDWPSSVDFTHFGCFQGALLDEELRMLAMNPQAIFKPQRTYVRNSYYPILSNLQATRGNTSASLRTNINY